jgi:hypothetical protein
MRIKAFVRVDKELFSVSEGCILYRHAGTGTSLAAINNHELHISCPPTGSTTFGWSKYPSKSKKSEAATLFKH